VRARRYRSALWPAVLVLVAGVAVNASYAGFYRDQPTHHAISWYTIGSAYLAKVQKDDALVAYESARESFEAYPSPNYEFIGRDIYLKLGGLYYEAGDCPGVIDTLGRVGGADAKGAAAARLTGECLERTGRPRDAIRAYQTVLQAQPGNTAALEGLARCYEATGNYQEAQRIRDQLRR
jgi:tetratricopeptide (TPR) repeat protein